MRLIACSLLFAVVGVGMGAANAASFNVCWQNPTENVDGSPLTDLERVRILWELESDATINGNDPYNTTEVGAELCTDITVPQDGDYTVKMRAIDADGDVSSDSNVVTKTAGAPVVPTDPLPPVILTSESTVFTVVKQPDKFVLLPIGTVPAGTECSQQEVVNGHGVVPNGDVVWTSPTGPRPIVVVAQCGNG